MSSYRLLRSHLALFSHGLASTAATFLAFPSLVLGVQLAVPVHQHQDHKLWLPIRVEVPQFRFPSPYWFPEINKDKQTKQLTRYLSIYTRITLLEEITQGQKAFSFKM